MCENPFFELVGAKGYSENDRSKRVENEFNEFKNKHGKQYKDEIEEAQRKTHFRHNYRWVQQCWGSMQKVRGRGGLKCTAIRD